MIQASNLAPSSYDVQNFWWDESAVYRPLPVGIERGHSNMFAEIAGPELETPVDVDSSITKFSSPCISVQSVADTLWSHSQISMSQSSPLLGVQPSYSSRPSQPAQKLNTSPSNISLPGPSNTSFPSSTRLKLAPLPFQKCLKCSLEFMTDKQLANHTVSCGPFICGVSGCVSPPYNSHSSLQRHQREKHKPQGRDYLCENGHERRVFKRREHWTRHLEACSKGQSRKRKRNP